MFETSVLVFADGKLCNGTEFIVSMQDYFRLVITMEPFRILLGHSGFHRKQFRVHCDRSSQHCHHFQDIKAHNKMNSMVGTKIQERCVGANGEHKDHQQECLHQMETVFIKQEADDEITMAEHGSGADDTKESRCVLFRAL